MAIRVSVIGRAPSFVLVYHDNATHLSHGEGWYDAGYEPMSITYRNRRINPAVNHAAVMTEVHSAKALK